MALVDGDVTAHEATCTTASTTTGGELVTWTLDLQHEFYLHTMRIYNTGCGELENELLSLTPCFIQYFIAGQKLNLNETPAKQKFCFKL